MSAQQFRRGLLILLAAGVGALLIMAGVASWLTLRSQGFNRWVDHTYVVEAHVNAFEAVIERAEPEPPGRKDGARGRTDKEQLAALCGREQV